jgi:hypothetical protein
MSSRRIHTLITGIAISVIGLTMGLGGAAAFGATPSTKGPATTAHTAKAHTVPAKHHKKGAKKHTKKHAPKKHRKGSKKASHKHQKHAARTHRA